VREQLRQKLASRNLDMVSNALAGPFKELSEQGFACLSDIRVRDAVLSVIKDRTNTDRLDKASVFVYNLLSKPLELHTDIPSVMIDEGKRRPYKPMQESKGPLEQILIRSQEGSLLDVTTVSRVIASVQDFKFIRAYVKRGDKSAEQIVQNAIEEGVKHAMAA
jgi:hypothetical protein